MPRAWYATDLSVSPPSRQIGATDVLEIPFQSDETATTATCKLIELGSGLEVLQDDIDPEDPQIPPPNTSVASDITTVTIDGTALGLERGHAYELAVTFADADEAWTGTLVLVVVV
jgi:hypothetical protein